MTKKTDGVAQTAKVMLLCMLLWPVIAVSMAKTLIRLVPSTKLPKD